MSTMTHKDEAFKSKIKKASDFKFGEKVVKVFDDMVNRSVPYYEEMQRMIAEIAADYAQPHTNIYDLGCSTGTSLLHMDAVVPPEINFVGIDDSPEMLIKCHNKLAEANFSHPYQLHYGDLNAGVQISNASVVVLCLTLQFVRPVYRERLLKGIVDGLVPNGVLILFEKVLGEECELNRNFIKYYYDMKRRHNYSEVEIAQKREALENVLIPYKQSENILMLRETGFAHCEPIFKWYNFSGLIAIKR